MTKISLIHPSYGRPEQAYKTFMAWIACSSHKVEIEHILSLDTVDPKHTQYYNFFSQPSSIISLANNTCVVEATNKAAKLATGDILLYLSDDFSCPVGWDQLIIEAFGERINEPSLVKVHDMLQKFDVDVLTIPIMTKHLYERLGYFFHPGYRSMFCDQHLFWVCKNNNWIIERPDLEFEHKHYSVRKSLKDETYKRSDANWEQGKALYAQHKKLNFPI